MVNPDLVSALWSVKEDAAHAYKRAMEGDDSGLEALSRSLKQLEAVVIRGDVIRTMVEDRRA